jgi:putative ABC transport system ATP-binding protein
MPVLVARDLYRFYHAGEDETLALRGVSLDVDGGEIVAVVGPSGSGKSTLIACLAGLDEPDGGFVTIGGRRLTRCTESERAGLRASHIGVLLQSRNLFPHLSVEDNLRLPMYFSRKVDERRLQELIAAVGLSDRRRARAAQLSGGEATRAALAAALAADPALLLADEPTGEVDAETERGLLDLLDLRRARGGATLIATHSEALAARADRVVELLDGRIVSA